MPSLCRALSSPCSLPALFYLVTILLTKSYPNRYAAVLAAFALLLVVYLWLLFYRPIAPLT